MATICLLTTGQPSTNPRLAKEANALAAAGHDVHVICAHWTDWADKADETLLQRAQYGVTYVGGRSTQRDLENIWRGIRHRIGHRISKKVDSRTAFGWALSRISPDLYKAARKIDADIYIAHNIGALPAAFAVAKDSSARCGFDAEDFHSGMSSRTDLHKSFDRVVERFESRVLPSCDYVTASSPLIAQHYSTKYGIARPATILNTFPLSDRPLKFDHREDEKELTLYWFSQTIGPGRGIEEIVRAIALITDKTIRLTLLGSTTSSYRIELKNLLQTLSLDEEMLTFMEPALPDEMVRIAAMHDVGLALEMPDSLNRDICLTNKIFTYLLAGNAILATATRAQRHFFEEIPDAGVCLDSSDTQAFADCLYRWSTDRSSLIRARSAAWKYGEKRFNWDIEKEKFLGVIERVLGRRAVAA